ncbi:hypothetical protein ACILPN_17745 [Yersinia wautersii]|uniref:Uncharacterized protein n=1 Tax=Yersinia pseudotuberculosis TaxID=633 RepID=A0A380Q9N4_YERPU|nr:hypothetical protein [Yersinia pseudotuberculosis]SUP83793.1 Uncharacterised protein [Yersinia pseudotuberculosis]
MLNKGKQLINSSNSIRYAGVNKNLPRRENLFSGAHGRKVITYCLLIGLTPFCWQVKGETVKFNANVPMSSIPDLESPLLSHEKEFNWIGNNVELLSPVSALSEPVTEPGAQPESSNTPNKGNHTQSEANKGRIGVEEKHELTPEGVHQFEIFLLIQIAIFLPAFLLSVYFSMRRTLRRDWAKHMPKGLAPKVSPIGMISILCVPRLIKSHRWQIWEQRQWFRDMKACYGLAVAYRDTWHWKRSIKAIDYQ